MISNYRRENGGHFINVLNIWLSESDAGDYTWLLGRVTTIESIFGKDSHN